MSGGETAAACPPDPAARPDGGASRFAPAVALPIPMVMNPNDPADAAAWLAVSDELISAVNHALNNRLAALLSLSRVLEFDDAAANPLVAVLQEEVERLERTTTLMRLLPRDPHEAAEPVVLADLFRDALALHRLRSGARDLEYDVGEAGDAPPAWAPPTALTHALLILLSALTTEHPPADAGAVRVTYGGDADEALLAIELPPALAAVAPEAAERLDAVEDRLARWGGSLVRDGAGTGGGPRIEVRLPSLAAARRSGADDGGLVG